MWVESKIGLLHDRVFVDEEEYEVLRGRRGWRVIIDTRAAAGRVRYDSLRDRLSIESPLGPLEIRFRWRGTTFGWRGRTYRVGSMVWNRLTIFEGDRPVLDGKMTWSGVRFETIDPEFREIARELAVGLGLRAMAIATSFVPLG